MRVRVVFRFNSATGEVEQFLVEDVSPPGRSAEDHDLEHERIAYEIGCVVERHPGIDEVIPVASGDRPLSAASARAAEDAEAETGTAEEAG